MEHQEQGSFFYILPSQVLNDKNLNHAEKLALTLIYGLANEQGKVWASNEWFSEKLGLKIRAIQTILENVEKLGYITRETFSHKNDPFKKYRIITVSYNFKLNLRHAKNCMVGNVENCADDMQKTACIIDKTNTLIDKREASPPPPPLFPSSLKKSKLPDDIVTYVGSHSQKARVWMERDKYDKLMKELGKDKFVEMLERLDEYADLNPPRFKRYACHATVIRKWVRDDANKQISKQGIAQKTLETDQKLLERLRKYSSAYPQLLIDCGHDYVVFAKIDARVAYKPGEKEFKQNILKCLKHMNINVDGWEKSL